MTYVSSNKQSVFPFGSQCIGECNSQQHYEENSWLGHAYDIYCQWEPFRRQILNQWPDLAEEDVDHAGPNSKYLAALINEKYGIDMQLIENYLLNFERTLPLQ